MNARPKYMVGGSVDFTKKKSGPQIDSYLISEESQVSAKVQMKRSVGEHPPSPRRDGTKRDVELKRREIQDGPHGSILFFLLP